MNMNINSITSELPTDMLSSTFLVGDVGAPFVIGLASGYFAKKMLRLALFIGGAAIVLMVLAIGAGASLAATFIVAGVLFTAIWSPWRRIAPKE